MTPGELYGTGAWAYDAAFSWDVGEEVDWLLLRMGRGTRSVLEPFCGAARMFPAFVRRGVAISGVDLSVEMLALAAARMAREGLPAPDVHRADAQDFDLGRVFDGAICPIHSLAQLTAEEAAAAHLDCMARHLALGARYLVQLDLKTPETLRTGVTPPQGAWEAAGGAVRVSARWNVASYDPLTRIETHVCEITALDGPHAGETVLSLDHCRLWTWEDWSALLCASPFEQVAAYDGNLAARPRLELGPQLADHPLTWHELVRR